MKIVGSSVESKWKVLFKCSFLVSLKVCLILYNLQLTECHSIDTLLDTPKFINENATIFHPIISPTKNSFRNLSLLSDVELKDLPWWCSCSAELEEVEDESECHCEGPKLATIPQDFINITRLSIANSKFKILREVGLRKYAPSLKDIILMRLNDFYQIEPDAFKNIRHLRTIYISHAPRLQFIAAETFRHVSHTLKTLRITHSGLREVPDMKYLVNGGILSQIDFEGNQISEIFEKSIRIRTEQLILDNNVLTTIHRAGFNGSEIGKLSLKGNTKLRQIHEGAFEGIESIQELDLSSTSIQSLPSIGLDKLEVLRIQNTQSLKQIPSVYMFKSLVKAWLTHSFHCCAFKFPQRHDPESFKRHRELINNFKSECKAKGYPQSNDDDPSSFNNYGLSTNINRRRRRRTVETYIVNDDESNITFPYSSDSISQDGDDIDGLFHEPLTFSNSSLEAMCGNLSINVKDVQCYPIPDVLNPCEDVMGSSWLRTCVWIVVSLAIIGNVAVLVVLLTNRSEFTVPKFLMCNLALADFCMGIYLMLIASIDLHSMGEYFNFAYDWQYGIGCKTAGWLTVFAGNLSVFTLTIITVERWFAITHAIYLNKRLKHRKAYVIMICGWLYSITIAVLPLFGISNYSSTSICLPMEAQDFADITYLITVLALNGLGFFIVVLCYTQIYFSLGKETRHKNASRGEMTVAKKMALLVFTNFACYAPIAFFGLTALAGYPLINVTRAKILLVFFYPLNSCANPYLYAILTAQYRRDLFLLLAKFGICSQRAQQYRMNSYNNPTHTIPLNMLSSIRNSSSMKYQYRNNAIKSNNNEQLLPDNTVQNECHLNGKIDNNLCDET
ncbi:lutropin-choriogonadotropic hormone receptor-like [Chironomus tepperi]|uniref:lutropin-choriogonadotropic hormone receptor-like n=1 Tax=Chironomus tepperi TaxID=113505 RepID=UPI00391F4F72